ncbi:hypothetical protein A2U01_0115943, partial [Trifolium medium]|nr:hypothetical protein [Trifolium medium]
RVRTFTIFRGSEVQRFRGYISSEDENASEASFPQKQKCSEASLLQRHKYSDALATPIASG